MEIMKIAFIGRGNLKTNASTLRALRLGKELSTKNIEIHLFLPRDDLNQALSTDKRNSFIKFHLCGRGISEFFVKLFCLYKYNFDFLHVLNVGLKSYFVAYVYKLVNRECKIILDLDEEVALLHNSKFRKMFLQQLENSAVKRSDIVLVASKYLFNKLMMSRSEKIYYFPYAIVEGNFHSNSKNNPYLDDSIKYAVYMGSFQNYEELSLIIKAAPVLNKLDNTLKILMIGDGPNKKKLEEESIKKELGNLKFLGYQSDENIDLIFQSGIYVRFST